MSDVAPVPILAVPSTRFERATPASGEQLSCILGRDVYLHKHAISSPDFPRVGPYLAQGALKSAFGTSA